MIPSLNSNIWQYIANLILSIHLVHSSSQHPPHYSQVNPKHIVTPIYNMQ